MFYDYALQEGPPSLSHPPPSAAATRSKQARSEGGEMHGLERREGGKHTSEVDLYFVSQLTQQRGLIVA